MSDPAQIRTATFEDVPELLRHRRGMYEDMGYNDDVALTGMMATSEPYLREALANRTLHAWIATIEDRVAGGGLIIVSPWLSHPYDQQCRRATVLNVYVDPEFRRRGIARQLMQTMIEWCRHQGFVTVSLHASEFGRPLYESLGFAPTTEMRLKLQ
jgi:GNAT superfamily N-acetyltransferase